MCNQRFRKVSNIIIHYNREKFKWLRAFDKSCDFVVSGSYHEFTTHHLQARTINRITINHSYRLSSCLSVSPEQITCYCSKCHHTRALIDMLFISHSHHHHLHPTNTSILVLRLNRKWGFLLYISFIIQT